MKYDVAVLPSPRFPPAEAGGEASPAGSVREGKQSEQSPGPPSDEVQQLRLSLRRERARRERVQQQLEETLYAVSHDFAAPARQLTAFAELLATEIAAEPGAREARLMDYMRDAASRLGAMTDGLLVLSRITSRGGPFVQFDPAHVFEQVCATYQSEVSAAGGSVSCQSFGAVRADPQQVKMAATCLVDNAFKFRDPSRPPRISLDADKSATGWELRVSDNGIGFEERFISRVWRPFQSLHPRGTHTGIGLGLAVVARIARRHGATLRTKSRPGRGTTFSICFPDDPYEALGDRQPPPESNLQP